MTDFSQRVLEFVAERTFTVVKLPLPIVKGHCLFLILLFAGYVGAQGGGHTLFGDIKVDESQADGLKPMSLQVLLYSESGNLILRQTVPSNGRYRFLDLRNGRYDVVVEVENAEIARVRVYITSPFKTDFRQDIELRWQERSRTSRAGMVSA